MAPPSPARPWIPFVLAASLAVAGSWAFSTSLRGVLFLDDIRAIARNPTIRTLWPLTTPLSPPSESTVAGRPVANLSFAINYALAPSDARDAFGPTDRRAAPATDDGRLRNLRGYHIANVSIHVIAALALFGVVARTLRSRRLQARFGGAAPWIAAVVAGMWLVHPLQTASVTYLVQRVESLMGLFYLLTLYCAIRADEGPRERLWTAAAITSCALGMATKEVMVTAPIVVWLWLRTFGRGPEDHGPRWPLLAGLAATWLILIGLVAGEQRAPSIATDVGTAWRYLLTQADVIAHYVRLALVPSSLVFLYTWPLASSLADVAVPAAVLTSLLVATFAGTVRRHPLAFPVAAFFLVLAPSSSILPIVTEVAAEHRMYLPLASLVACAVIGVYLAGTTLIARRGRAAWLTRAATTAAAVAAICAMLALGLGTRERGRDYWSEERLWGDTVEKRPDNPRARVAYGEALASMRKLGEAESQLRAAVALAPDDGVALVRLGTVQAAQGRLDEAIMTLERALITRPDDVDAHRALGEAYAIQRADARAVAHFERVVAQFPDDAAMLARLAALLADSRDPMVRDGARAERLARQAVALTSRSEPALLEVLAVAQAATGRYAEAAVTTEEAIAVSRARGLGAVATQLERRAAAYRALATARAPR